jgi:hypothetical protein
MNLYWNIERARTVTAYLIQLREEGEALREAISLLQEGVPQDAYLLETNEELRAVMATLREGVELEVWEWIEAQHWIVFFVDRTPNRRWIYVADVESATVE